MNKATRLTTLDEQAIEYIAIGARCLARAAVEILMSEN